KTAREPVWNVTPNRTNPGSMDDLQPPGRHHSGHVRVDPSPADSAAERRHSICALVFSVADNRAPAVCWNADKVCYSLPKWNCGITRSDRDTYLDCERCVFGLGDDCGVRTSASAGGLMASEPFPQNFSRD